MSTITIRYGRLGQDPELRFTPAGKAVCELSVAENHRRRGESGEWEDDGTTWYRVTLWEDDAEAAAGAFRKGDRVTVTGELRTREFERRDGTRGLAVEIGRAVVGGLPVGDRKPSGRQRPVDDPWAADRPTDDTTPPF